MTHFAVCDDFYDHPKTAELSDAAVALWTRAGSYCGRYLTDGFVPSSHLARFRSTPETAEELVAAGLWVVSSGVVPGGRPQPVPGYRYHEWERHNPLRSDVLAKRAQWAAKKGRQRSAKSDAKPEMSPGDSPGGFHGGVSSSHSHSHSHSEREKNPLPPTAPAEPLAALAERSALGGCETGTADTSSSSEAPLSGHSHGVFAAAPASGEQVVLSGLPDASATKQPKRAKRTGENATDPVFEHWCQVMGKTGAALLTDDRKKKLKARRAERFTDEQLCQAIDGCALSPFHMGQNERGEKYNDLATILRDGSTVEKHIERARNGGPRPQLVPTRPGRMPLTHGTTEADFADVPDLEDQIPAEWRAREAVGHGG